MTARAPRPVSLVSAVVSLIVTGLLYMGEGIEWLRRKTR